MFERVTTGCLVIVGIIHLLPVTGVIGAERLAILYDVAIDDHNVAILMRHRAVLFGLLGAYIVLAAFKPSIQPLAFIAAFVSITSFLWIAFSTGDFNHAIHRVFVVDIVAVLALCGAVTGWYCSHRL